MKLLVIGAGQPPEPFLQQLFDGLESRGARVSHARMMSTDAGLRGIRLLASLATRAIPRPGAAAHWLSQRSTPEAPSNLATRCRRTELWLRVLASPADVLYFPWNSGAVDHLPLFAIGIPTLISCRGSQLHVAPHDPQRAAFVRGLRETIGRATAIHCVSQAIADEAQRYGLEPRKATVIRPAVDTAAFGASHRQTGGGPLRLLSVGALRWVKGYEYSLRAMRLAVDRGLDLEYRILGEGPDRERLEYTIADLGLQGRVQLLGSRTREQVQESLGWCDLFLCPSVSEGISNAVLEAMACGAAVITTDCGGMTEAIDHEVHGLVVPTREPESMAAAIARLGSKLDLRSRLADAARKRVSQEFSLPRQIADFQRLLESIA